MVIGKREIPIKDEYFRKYYWDFDRVASNCHRWSTCKFLEPWKIKSARFSKICPSSAYYYFDAYSMQGRVNLTNGLEVERNLKYEDCPGLMDIFYTCTMCGGCDAMCKSCNDLEPLRMLQEMRSRLVENGWLLPQHMLLIDNLRKEDNMMMKPKSERGRWAEGLKVKDLTNDKAEVVFHCGCSIGFDDELWPIARVAVSLLELAGVDFGILGKDESCCGGRAYEMGYQGEFTKFAENNLDLWANTGAKTVVTPCSDCYYTFKRLYPEVGSKLEVLHMVEMLDRLIKDGKLKLNKSVPMTVTYHDPCHLGRRTNVYVPGEPITGIYEPPRDVIKSIPGITLVEMERNRECAWCCGASGGVRESYPDFNLWTAQERLAEAKATGAEAIVTACPWCVRNFRDALSASGQKMKVYDVVELVAQAI
ncbi:(Fe-S)-binding protein [Chloroflexota bacterium]